MADTIYEKIMLDLLQKLEQKKTRAKKNEESMLADKMRVWRLFEMSSRKRSRDLKGQIMWHGRCGVWKPFHFSSYILLPQLKERLVPSHDTR